MKHYFFVLRRADRRAEKHRREIDIFVSELKKEAPTLLVKVDRPKSPRGETWLDIDHGDFSTSVAWKTGADRGFGLFYSSPGFGDRPDIVLASPKRAAAKLLQLYRQEFSNNIRRSYEPGRVSA